MLFSFVASYIKVRNGIYFRAEVTIVIIPYFNVVKPFITRNYSMDDTLLNC